MVDAESEQFSLRWNNFHSNLTAGFHALLEGEDLVDVTLAAGGQFVQAHKIVLSVCSPYFKELFKVNPCKHPIVILKDVGHKELVAILHFMYQGEVNVRQDDLATFLKIAEMLQIKGLTGDDSSATNTQQPSVPKSRERTPPPPPQLPLRRERTPPPPPVRREITPPLRQSSALTSIIEPLPVQSEETTVRPFKRMRAEATIVPVPPPPAPMQTPTSSLKVTSPCTVNEDTSGVEFVEITKPKDEPVDYESDIEEVDNKIEPVREDPLVQLLGGESSSQSHQDSSQGATPPIFASIPGLSQDSGGTPEGGQAMFVPSERGHPKLLLNGHIYTKEIEGRHYIVWRCRNRTACSARLRQNINDLSQMVLRKPHSHPPDWVRYKMAAEHNRCRAPRQPN